VLDMLIAPEDFGTGFSAVTYVAGADGGYDSVSLGPAAIPADGLVGLVPICIEGTLVGEPFNVRRLVENGQTLRDVEAPASWRGGATLPVEPKAVEALRAIIGAADADGDGRASLNADVSLFEDGVVIRQRPDLEIVLDGELAQLSLELGLTRRGYHVLRDIELASSGDPVADAWLKRAVDALRQTMPPFRSTAKAGLVVGKGSGSCVPWLALAETDDVVPPATDEAAPSA
jgi:hypothetical protein